MLKVFQIQLTNEEVDIINSDGEYTPKIKAFFSRVFDSNFNASNFQYYTHVANVATDDMEEAFRAMNLWDDAAEVQKVATRCSSMSVGDIIENEQGERFVCASFGFDKI